MTVGTAVTTSLGAGSISYYQYPFPSNGLTITLNVGTGLIYCYASDRFQNPNEENYDWKIVVSGYADVFIDPNLLGRTPGSNIYIGLQGGQSSNTFTLDSATGDMRGIIGCIVTTVTFEYHYHTVCFCSSCCSVF